MRHKFPLFLLCFYLGALTLAAQGQKTQIEQIGKDMQLIPLSERVIIHRSFLYTDDGERIPCNGLIYVVDSTCFIMDTPATMEATDILLDYLQKQRRWAVKGVIVNHFHEDCTAGLPSFHARGIKSYGHKRTLLLCKEKGEPIPQIGLGNKKTLRLGKQKIQTYYPGAAHTSDNMAVYLPAEQVLFGGCMVKAVQASKGNVADADEAAWPATIQRLKKRFSEAAIVVPGHGWHGGQELLDYTIQLFSVGQ